MSGVSFPVSRPGGRVLVVGTASNRPGAVAVLQQLGLSCSEVEDPYAAMIELARRPMVYRATILSLASLFKEEMALVATIKRRMPHVEVWLTHTDGRAGALAEAMRLGADGLLSQEGLHRTAVGAPEGDVVPHASNDTPLPEKMSDKLAVSSDELDDEPKEGEPVLTADELRALLQEQTDSPEQE
jgi:hypothetical protein